MAKKKSWRRRRNGVEVVVRVGVDRLGGNAADNFEEQMHRQNQLLSSVPSIFSKKSLINLKGGVRGDFTAFSERFNGE